MRIYHLGALFIFFISLGIIIGYSLDKLEVFAVSGFIFGTLPIVIYRRSIIKKEKVSNNKEDKTSYT
ncbi:hypothetical protein [Oceanobacillus neutriphilus]|uniref:Uncharacterized protein n=1 Tax=Oceanobacillus neutriphilus TaxID=531815 RepID=A0ABQ2NXV1_9BACI|nr:hypothetical protein [Oceanobacillus neutriphilus]GGP13229.1 hypothetical protein GCM10011346_32370 [Oceanobacillus neutriphilus]